MSSQTQNQIASFLEAIISAYPPLSNYKIEMNFHNPDKMEETKFFLYQNMFPMILEDGLILLDALFKLMI